MLELNLPSYEYKLKKRDGKLLIWDRTRKKYIILQPEEWVRQHFVNYLIEIKNIPVSHISLEQGHQYNSLTKRTDILVYDNELKPLLLVECKASHIEINDDVLFQAVTYQSQIHVKYICLTNGLEHQYYQKKDSEFVRIEELPEYNVLI